MGLFRTLDDIVDNPLRSRFWKIVDVTLLGVLWIGAVVFVVMWLIGDPFSNWYFAARIWVPITLLATCRSWYRFPKKP